MTDRASNTAPEENDIPIQVLGETGGTVVYIFPNGSARVKKGKKLTLASAPEKSVSNQGNLTRPEPSSQTSSIAIKPPPPPRSQSSQLNCPEPSSARNTATQTVHPAPKVNSGAQTIDVTQRLRRYLLKQGLVTTIQLEVAQYDSTASGLSLEDALVARGWITPEAIAQFRNA